MNKIKTENYILGENKFVEVNEVYCFGELWDGDGDGEEILQSGQIAMYNESKECVIVDFEIIEKDEDILKTLVKVTDID